MLSTLHPGVHEIFTVQTYTVNFLLDLRLFGIGLNFYSLIRITFMVAYWHMCV
jgi:hypothetical protein